VVQDVIHITWGGEERRARIQASPNFANATVTLCGKPLSREEMEIYETTWTADAEGNLIPFGEQAL